MTEFELLLTPAPIDSMFTSGKFAKSVNVTSVDLNIVIVNFDKMDYIVFECSLLISRWIGATCYFGSRICFLSFLTSNFSLSLSLYIYIYIYIYIYTYKCSMLKKYQDWRFKLFKLFWLNRCNMLFGPQNISLFFSNK